MIHLFVSVIPIHLVMWNINKNLFQYKILWFWSCSYRKYIILVIITCCLNLPGSSFWKRCCLSPPPVFPNQTCLCSVFS